MEVTKDICCVKDKNAVDYSRVTRWFKKFHLGCKNLDDHAKSGGPKTKDSKTVLEIIETNLREYQANSHLTVQCGSLLSQPQQKHPMTNCVSCYQNIASTRALENVEYPFITITPSSTLTWSSSTC